MQGRCNSRTRVSNSTTPNATPTAIATTRATASRPLRMASRKREGDHGVPARAGRGDSAVTDHNFPVGVRRDPRLVGDEDDRGAFGCGATQQVSMTCSPVSESRDPVGSSANNTFGLVTRPRASATRCDWPPESSPDRRPPTPIQPEPRKPPSGGVDRRPASDAVEQQRQRDVLLGA